jgi:peptidoglycan/xylan/chitin deacetylase (PgdA/CDA1 family)
MKLRHSLHRIMRRAQLLEPKPVILMYHRIADEPVDPWGLAVSPARFEEQLQVLRRTRYPLPLTDFVRHLQAGTLPPHAVALTLDDGYADNFLVGKPRLAAADVPATVFLITGFLDCPDELWWDELARLILLERGPRSLELVVRDMPMKFDFDMELPSRETDTWRASSPPVTQRQHAFAAIWEALRPLEHQERRALMAELRSMFRGRKPAATSSRTMTSDEVRQLASSGIVTIGAHTVTHPPLTHLKSELRRCEIKESKVTSEALIGAQVTGFAYPYGDFDHQVRSAVEGAGFAFACSTRQGPAVTSDVLTLPRIQINDWDGEAFDRKLRSLAGS